MCATSTDLIIQVKEGSHADHQLLMFSVTCIHKFINTIYILCLKMLILTPQMILPLSEFLDCVKFCDSRQVFLILPSHIIHQSGSFFDVFPHSLVGVKEVGHGLTMVSTYWARQFLLP